MVTTRKQLAAMVPTRHRPTKRPESAFMRGLDGKVRGNIGHLSLSVNAPGDGWARYGIEETANEAGGVTLPFGGGGWTASECGAVLGALITCAQYPAKLGCVRPDGGAS